MQLTPWQLAVHSIQYIFHLHKIEKWFHSRTDYLWLRWRNPPNCPTALVGINISHFFTQFSDSFTQDQRVYLTTCDSDDETHPTAPTALWSDWPRQGAIVHCNHHHHNHHICITYIPWENVSNIFSDNVFLQTPNTHRLCDIVHTWNCTILFVPTDFHKLWEYLF